MVRVDVGGLDGTTVDTDDGGTYKFGVHGFDNVSGYYQNYDEIDYDAENRWHLESYFEPVPDDADTAYYPRYANFGISNPDDDYYQKFCCPSPTESQMDSGGDFNLPNDFGDAFDAISSFSPWLSAGKAVIKMKLNGDPGSVTDSMPNYNGCDWHIPMDSYDAGLPDSQENSAGARIDVHNNAKSSWYNQVLDASSEFGYKEIDAWTGQTFYHVTPTASCNPEYYIPE